MARAATGMARARCASSRALSPRAPSLVASRVSSACAHTQREACSIDVDSPSASPSPFSTQIAVLSQGLREAGRCGVGMGPELGPCPFARTRGRLMIHSQAHLLHHLCYTGPPGCGGWAQLRTIYVLIRTWFTRATCYGPARQPGCRETRRAA